MDRGGFERETTDGALDGVQTCGDLAEACVDAAEACVDAAEARIDTVEARVDTVEARVDVAEACVDVAESFLVASHKRVKSRLDEFEELRSRNHIRNAPPIASSIIRTQSTSGSVASVDIY